jgi:hypothetical protein
MIENIYDYQKIIEYIKKTESFDGFWFRGVLKSNYKLIPSIYRKETWNYTQESAENLTNIFINKAKGYLPNSSVFSRWEWYHNMQHYGVPTRLLDWTEGYLIALFFAVRNLNMVSTPCIYMINPVFLNFISTGDAVIYFTDQITRDNDDIKITEKYIYENHKDLPKFPIAIIPPYANERMTVQRSCFTIHGRIKDGFSGIKKEYEAKKLLFKLRIKTKSANILKKELFNAGISEATLFPDLEGLARDFRYEYNMK